MRNTLRLGVYCLLASNLLAQTATTTKTAPRRGARPTTATQSRVDAELRELRDAVVAQQTELRQVQDALAQRDQAIQQAQQRIQQLESRAQEAESKTTAAVTTAGAASDSLTAVQRDVTDLKTIATNTSLSIQDDQRKFGDLIESPNVIHFRGVTLTPGGFIDAVGYYRNHNENSSMNSATADTNTPLEGQGNTFLHEFRGDARHSRLSLLGEGKLANLSASAYYETDFLGAAPTSNENESNSFVMRMRQLWAQARMNNGWTFSAGQMWSLITTTRSGQELRAEFQPQVIDAQYLVGFNWARQWGIRVTKNFHNKVWVAASVENPSTIVSSLNPPATILGLNNSLNALTPSGLLVTNCCNNTLTISNPPGGTISSTIPGIANGVSTNIAPDLLAKVVFEPGWGHYEIKMLGRFFRDRFVSTATNTGTNDIEAGGGIGAGVILPLVKKKVDLIAQGLYGEGIGRYSSGQGPDVTIRPDATLAPIRAGEYMFGLETHPTPKLDWVAYWGEDHFSPKQYVNGAKGVGYGSIGANNSGCELEVVGACQAQTDYAWQATTGFNYRFFRARQGTLQYGINYSYVYRQTYRGANSLVPGAPAIAPIGIEQMVLTNVRYVFP